MHPVGRVLKLRSSLLFRPELKFGLVVESPLKRTKRESLQDLQSVSTDFPSLARTSVQGEAASQRKNSNAPNNSRRSYTEIFFLT